MKLNKTEFCIKVVPLVLTPDQKENCEHIYVDILEQIEVNTIFLKIVSNMQYDLNLPLWQYGSQCSGNTTFVAKDEKPLTRQGHIVFFNIKHIIMKKEVPESILERESDYNCGKKVSFFLGIIYTSNTLYSSSSQGMIYNIWSSFFLTWSHTMWLFIFIFLNQFCIQGNQFQVGFRIEEENNKSFETSNKRSTELLWSVEDREAVVYKCRVEYIEV